MALNVHPVAVACNRDDDACAYVFASSFKRLADIRDQIIEGGLFDSSSDGHFEMSMGERAFVAIPTFVLNTLPKS